MKRLAYLLPMAAIALASCSSDETIATQADITQDAILINPIVPGATRATETTKASLGSFTVIAGQSDGLKETGGFTTTVSSNDNGTTWSMESQHYWTQDDSNASTSVSFTAYAPADMTASGGKISVDLTGKKIDEQKDIIVAFNTGSKKNNIEGVSLCFKHVFSQIVINAANKNTDMRTVEVLGVKLVNIPSKADLTLPTSTTTKESALSVWGTLSTDADFMVEGSTAVTLGNEAQSIMFGKGSFMLIPQQLSKWDGTSSKDGARIAVLCRIISKVPDSEGQIFPATADKYAFTSVPIDTKWEPGKKYTYTLNFYSGDNGGAGTKDPEQNNPDDEDDNNIDPNPGTGGDSTDLGVEKPIKFTVDVETWAEVASGSNTLSF